MTEAKNAVENYLFNVKDAINEISSCLPQVDKKRTKDAIEQTIAWIKANSNANFEELVRKMEELESVLNPIITKAMEEDKVDKADLGTSRSSNVSTGTRRSKTDMVLKWSGLALSTSISLLNFDLGEMASCLSEIMGLICAYDSVYRALIHTGKIVALKKLHKLEFENPTFDKSFRNETKMLTEIRHRNIVKLYGFCLHNKNMFLVYE
ncbi:MDIS1-interacting receptor like kinase 2-like [Senna tora]|uniref:non-specific serine/threonine protein kinase n=1 Tax=Senna tora TaxID=362788 RepID=A0A834X605_9FABA|nr:MDIS1-interacting receptor like kinase 2-like [Senna tora]